MLCEINQSQVNINLLINKSYEGMKKGLHLLGEPVPSFTYEGWNKTRILWIVCLSHNSSVKFSGSGNSAVM